MADDRPDIPPLQDRRLETRVYEQGQKLHALELESAQQKIEVATMKGEINALRGSSATSFEVKAASELLTVKLDHLHRDLSAIKTILLWAAGLVIAGFVGALLKMVFIP